MKYYVIYISNGALQTNKITEHDTMESALVAFHDKCKTLWNTASVKTGCVAILDQSLNVADGKREYISHVQPEPEA